MSGKVNGAKMAPRDGLSVPEKDLANWREKDALLERQINELIQQRSEIKARLDAAALLAAAMGEKEEKEPSEKTGTTDQARAAIRLPTIWWKISGKLGMPWSLKKPVSASSNWAVTRRQIKKITFMG